MTKTLDWLDTLNEQATWKSYEELLAWMSGVLGRQINPSEKAVEEFQNGLNFIRQQLFAMHFGEGIDLSSLNTRLEKVRLHIKYPGADGLAGLPVLAAQLRTDNDDAILTTVFETLLVQFAFFLNEALSSELSVVARCEGLYREPGWKNISPVESVPQDIELKWRREIPVLVDSGLEDSPDVLRCADFFISRSKGRFCSDECRFRTFQISKQLSQPAYLADKQRRYRQRKDK